MPILFSIQMLVFRFLSKYLMFLVTLAIFAQSTECLCQLTLHMTFG